MIKRTKSFLIKAALISVAVITMFALTGTAQAQTATITGTVVDAATGLPIEGASVMLRSAEGGGGGGHQGSFNGGFKSLNGGYNNYKCGGWGGGGGGGMGCGPCGGFTMIRVYTDANGVYVIENLEAGDYLMRATACGYVPTDLIPVTVVEGETLVQDCELNLR
jgi:hypothetical protein